MKEELIKKDVCSVNDLQEGQMKAYQVGPDEKEDKILLAKVDGQYYAVGAKCSHFGLPLEAGLLFDDKVYCPFHFASFSVKTGMHEFGPTF